MIVKKSIPAGADIFNFPAGFKPKYSGFVYFYYGTGGNFKVVVYSGDKLSNHSDVINNGDWFLPTPFMYFVS